LKFWKFADEFLGSPVVHHKQFTARAIHRRAIHRKAVQRKAIHRKQFTGIFFKSPQSKFNARQFIAEAIHRRGNSPQGNSSQEQFTANNSPQKN
jgi:hypothetical protein